MDESRSLQLSEKAGKNTLPDGASGLHPSVSESVVIYIYHDHPLSTATATA